MMRKNSPQNTSGSVEQPSYDVYELKTESESEKTAFLFKLTDECNSILSEAMSKRWKIGLEITANKVPGEGAKVRRQTSKSLRTD